jgi:hypothetical protein
VADIRDRWARAVLSSTDLSCSQKVTCWAIREYANRDGEAMMGARRLAADTGKHPRTAQRHLSELEATGYVDRIQGKGVPGRGGITALTKLTIPESCGRMGAVASNALMSERYGGGGPHLQTEDTSSHTEAAAVTVPRLGEMQSKVRQLGAARTSQPINQEPGAAAHERNEGARAARSEGPIPAHVVLMRIRQRLGMTPVRNDAEQTDQRYSAVGSHAERPAATDVKA